MLSTDAGFEYLTQEGFLEPELARWKTLGYVDYVLELEGALEVASAKDKIWREEDKQAVDIPPHFYGELAKTLQGGELLAASGHIPHFTAVLRDKSADISALQRRAALWVLVRSPSFPFIILFVALFYLFFL
jgi:hypothetical protein